MTNPIHNLTTGRDLADDEPVQCDLPPHQPPAVPYAPYRPATHTAVRRLVTGRSIPNRIDTAKVDFDRKMSAALSSTNQQESDRGN